MYKPRPLERLWEEKTVRTNGAARSAPEPGHRSRPAAMSPSPLHRVWKPRSACDGWRSAGHCRSRLINTRAGDRCRSAPSAGSSSELQQLWRISRSASSIQRPWPGSCRPVVPSEPTVPDGRCSTRATSRISSTMRAVPFRVVANHGRELMARRAVEVFGQQGIGLRDGCQGFRISCATAADIRPIAAASSRMRASTSAGSCMNMTHSWPVSSVCVAASWVLTLRPTVCRSPSCRSTSAVARLPWAKVWSAERQAPAKLRHRSVSSGDVG